MRTSSLINGLVVLAGVVILGSGCETIEKYCGCGPKTEPTVAAVTPPEATLPVADTNLLDASEIKTALSGKPWAEDRTVDASAIFPAVHFALDSAVLPPTEVSKVEQVAQFLLDNPTRVANVDGHCDERGSNEYNLSLGEQRAQSVRTYLINLGVDAARIQTRSFGKEKPLDTGHNEAAWAKNRRGEYVIYK
jgi:peptidoglycan-associated lipoprotein